MSDMQVHKEGKTLTLTRTIDAPREKVWRAWTTKELFEKWWGPEGWQTTVKVMDFSVGGVLHYGMKCEDENQKEWYGKYSWGKSVYQSIDEPNEFTYIDYFCDENGVVDDNMPSFSITMKFDDLGAKTRIISISELKSEEELEALTKMGMIEGVTQTWDRLELLMREEM